MAVAASCKRAVQIGASSASALRRFNVSTPTSIYRTSIIHPSTNPYASVRYMAQLANFDGKRAAFVDTLALTRGLEAQGIPPKQADAITTAITKVSSDNLNNASQSFVSKLEIQKFEMIQETSLSQFKSEVESNLSQFKSEVKSSQENYFSSLQRQDEKLLNDIEKMRGELRYEIDKVTAGQRLDLNLERGRIRDELANQNAETTNLNNKFDREITNLNNKIDREIHAFRAQLEGAKLDVIKYCIGTIVSLTAIGLATIIRVLM